MWLQIITNDEPLYLAIVYAPPNKNALLQKVLSSIESTYACLSKLGKVLLMGDFNCRIGKLTRDSCIARPRADHLLNFLDTIKFKPLKNKQDHHWTCYTFNGQSVNDLFLLNKKELTNCTEFKVFKNHSFGSDHRLT